MDKSSCGQFVFASCLLLVLQLSFFDRGDALQCYECTYNKLDSSLGVLDFVLSAFEKISDEHCLLKTEEDSHVINIKNCPKPKANHVAKCATLEGTVNTKLGALSIDYFTVERSCVEVSVDDSETTDGCHTDLPANGVARNLLEKTFSGLNFGDISFDGHTCYTRKTVPVPGLQCIKCTWNDVETSNPLLNTFINGLENLSSQNCKLENLEEDKYNVNLRNCPAPREGYINKCGTISGKITATATIIFDMDIEYLTTQRDCIEVAEDAYAYTDGCHSDLPANGPTRALILETFAGLNLGDIQFDGKACYDQEADTRIASLQTSGATSIQITCKMFAYGLLTIIVGSNL